MLELWPLWISYWRNKIWPGNLAPFIRTPCPWEQQQKQEEEGWGLRIGEKAPDRLLVLDLAGPCACIAWLFPIFAYNRLHSLASSQHCHARPATSMP